MEAERKGASEAAEENGFPGSFPHGKEISEKSIKRVDRNFLPTLFFAFYG